MSRVFIVNRKQLTTFVIGLIVLVGAVLFFKAEFEEVLPVTTGVPDDRIIHMVTGEFKATLEDGTEIEAYRWDPGTIFVDKGESVKLSIYGVNGASHPFIIEGLDIKEEVKKGKETIISFKADKEGTYRIICLAHPDITNNGPMIGYIVVD